jgi:hypothetical protein
MELVHAGLWFFDRNGVLAREKRLDVRAEDEAKKERRLFCAVCRHPVTHQDERIEVNGAHQHRRTNPGGYTFGIGCFHEAAGCIAVGEATEAHTWFKGYGWRIAVCASCEQHLGWRFQGPADYFHGLILARLTSVAGAGNER